MHHLFRRLAAALMTAALALSLCACAPLGDMPAVSDTLAATPTPEAELPPIPNLEKKYFLSQLSGGELEFCTRLYAGLMALEENISVSGTAIDFDRADALIQALFDDCPELYMCTGDYTIRGIQTAGSLEFKYRMTREEYYSAAIEVSGLIGKWQEGTDGLADYDKALYVYDSIAALCSYSADDELSDTAYGALIEGKALCQGYSKAFQLAMYSLGMRCLFVSSEEMMHGWNIIELDGKFYQLDLTWDDSGDVGTYAYFNMSDELARKLGHVYDRSEAWDYPDCSSMEHNYYAKNGLLISADTALMEEFHARLDVLHASGGGRLTLMFEEAEQLNELTEKHHDWVSQWNQSKQLTISYTRIITENNDYVYIADFSFE